MKIRTPEIPWITRLARKARNLPPRRGGVRVRGAAVLLLLVVAGGSGTQIVLHNREALPDDAAFRVHGTVVTKDELQRRVTLMEFLYGLQQPSGAKRKDEFRRQVAKAVAVGGIIEQAARERGIVIADKAASDQLTKLVTENSWQDRRTFIQELGARGISEGAVLEEIKRQQANVRLFQQITKDVPAATDADARRYYDQHRDQMVSPASRAISNIVLETREEAQAVADEAVSGADFAEIARRRSIDASTKDKGGALGTVTEDQLDPGYAKAAFGARKGAVFGPVRTPQGWNVGKVTEVHDAVPLSFDQLRDTIKTKLTNDAKFAAWNTFLAERIKAAAVVYAPEYQPADPDAPPGETVRRGAGS